jgi:hypothetical protein
VSEPRLGRLVALVVVSGILMLLLGAGFAVGTVCALIATVAAFVWRATVRAAQS